MAEKHKSKYKKPENKKHTYRKDIKDYTMDDKDEKMNLQEKKYQIYCVKPIKK